MSTPADKSQRSLVTALAEALGRTITVKKPSPKGRTCVAQIREQGVAKPFKIRVSVYDRQATEDDAWGAAGAYLLVIAGRASSKVISAWISQQQSRERARAAVAAYHAALAAASPEERRLFDAFRDLRDATRDGPSPADDAAHPERLASGTAGADRRLSLLILACRSLATPVGVGRRVPLSCVSTAAMQAVMTKRGWQRHATASPSNDGVSIERWLFNDNDSFLKLRVTSETDVRLWCDDVARAHQDTSAQEVLAEAFAEAGVSTE